MQARDKILIVGSEGMLGSDLWDELGRNYSLSGLDIRPSARRTDGKRFKVDITDREAVLDAVLEASPDFVVHTAAMTDVDGCENNAGMAYAINADATENIARACKEAHSTLVYLSTDFVFDGRKEEPYREDDSVGPLSVYGSSKLKGEEIVKNSVKEFFIVRTSWLFGRRGKNFVDTIAAKAKESAEVRVVDDQVGSPTYTKDLSKALASLIGCCIRREVRADEYGIYHVSNSGVVSWFGFAEEIVRLSGLNARVVPITSEELTRPAKRPKMSVLDNTKFEKFASFKMRHWKDALKDYLSEKRPRP